MLTALMVWGNERGGSDGVVVIVRRGRGEAIAESRKFINLQKEGGTDDCGKFYSVEDVERKRRFTRVAGVEHVIFWTLRPKWRNDRCRTLKALSAEDGM